jgi:hypothetical protein
LFRVEDFVHAGGIVSRVVSFMVEGRFRVQRTMGSRRWDGALNPG